MKPLFPFRLNRNSVQAPGLVFWGPGGFGSGNLYDFSGSGDVGQIFPLDTPSWVFGVDGGQTALTYDGATSYTHLVSSSGLLQGTDAISVTFWVNSTATSRIQYLAAMWGVVNDSWSIYAEATTGHLHWLISTNNAYQAGNELVGSINVIDGKWHLVICTYDGVNTKIYVDGQLDATLGVTGNIGTNASQVYFGALSDGSNTGDWFIGHMDDPRIYNYALPQNVVTNMWNPATRWNLRQKPKKYDFFSVSSLFSLTATDALAVAESAVRLITEPRTTTDALTVAESVVRIGAFHRTDTDALAISESVVRAGVFNRSVTQTLTITQNAIEVGDELASNTLTITQSAIYKTPNQKASQSLSITETLSRSGSTFGHSASNSLSLISVADYFQFKPRSINQSLTITQSATETQSSGFFQSLTITQTLVTAYDPHSDGSSESLTLTQTVSAPLIRPRSPSESLTIAQTVHSQKLLHRTITQPLVVIQTTTALARTGINQSLTVAQAVVHAAFKSRHISQSLTLTHSVSVALNLVRSVTSTLMFFPEHHIPDGTGGFLVISNLIYTMGGQGGGICCPVPGRSTTIVGRFSTIVLPNPELGDAEAPVSAIKILRTITGDIYTYVRKNASRKLKYKFIITRKKAYELRVFLLQNLTQRVNMTNWKGEMWNVNFLTDPVDLVAEKHGTPPCGEWYSVELDFEGVRIN